MAGCLMLYIAYHVHIRAGFRLNNSADRPGNFKRCHAPMCALLVRVTPGISTACFCWNKGLGVTVLEGSQGWLWCLCTQRWRAESVKQKLNSRDIDVSSAASGAQQAHGLLGENGLERPPRNHPRRIAKIDSV